MPLQHKYVISYHFITLLNGTVWQLLGASAVLNIILSQLDQCPKPQNKGRLKQAWDQDFRDSSMTDGDFVTIIHFQQSKFGKFSQGVQHCVFSLASKEFRMRIGPEVLEQELMILMNYLKEHPQKCL